MSLLNISKRIWRELWQAAIVLVLGFVLGAVLFTQCSSPKPASTIGPEVDMLLEGIAGLEQTIDEQGRQITETRNAMVTPAQLRTYNDSIYAQVQREIGKRNANNLNARQHLSTVTRIVERVPVHDTVYIADNSEMLGEKVNARTFRFRDDWTTIAGVILQDSLDLDFETRADLTINHYWERRLFKPDVLHAKLTTNNPHLRVNRFATLNVPHQPAWYNKWWFKATTHALAFTAGAYTANRLQ